jgi:putative spermidine/putrescine transport system substrate-binding protein
LKKYYRSALVASGISAALIGSVLLAPVQAADASTATSLKDFGSFAALEKACKDEGQLNVIALQRDWANWGELIDTFIRKYPTVNVDQQKPGASSAEELQAIRSLKGSNRAPDVVDVGLAAADQGAKEGLFTPYKVQTWDSIAGVKEKSGLYYADYGGTMSIGYDANRVKVAPKSLKDLSNPIYKNQVALNGNPTTAGAALNAMFAISVSAKGAAGLNDIQSGINVVSSWKKNRIFVPIEADGATVANGQTPITLDWDYLQNAYASGTKKVNWKVVVPTDAIIGGYYYQAVSKTAPNPACARLWMEWIYSDAGSNLWLASGATPSRYADMVKRGVANKKYAARIPKLPAGSKVLTPSLTQQVKARNTLIKNWGKI